MLRILRLFQIISVEIKRLIARKEANKMMWDDIKLVTEKINKYGLRLPLGDLGGVGAVHCADYDITIKTGDQDARNIKLDQDRPFSHIDKDYEIYNPEGGGDQTIEAMIRQYKDHFGTVICLNVLEHVENPFEVFDSLYTLAKEDSLLVISTVFSFPYHPSPIDYWRYTPACLEFLAKRSGFKVLEADWRFVVPGDAGVLNTQNNEAQEMRSVYVVLTKGGFKEIENPTQFKLPKKIYKNEEIRKLMEG